MIKAKAGDLVILGLSAENIKRLKLGKPILIDNAELGLEGAGDVVLTSSDIGLGNVDNTSDADKPVSTAQQTALDAKLAIASNLSDVANRQTAIDNVTDVASATTGYILTKDGSGNATFQPAPGGGGGTNLSIANITANTLDIASDTGTDATVPAATTTTAGLLTDADKTLVDTIVDKVDDDFDSLTEKASITTGDLIVINDSQDSLNLKKVDLAQQIINTIAALKAVVIDVTLDPIPFLTDAATAFTFNAINADSESNISLANNEFTVPNTQYYTMSIRVLMTNNTTDDADAERFFEYSVNGGAFSEMTPLFQNAEQLASSVNDTYFEGNRSVLLNQNDVITFRMGASPVVSKNQVIVAAQLLINSTKPYL